MKTVLVNKPIHTVALERLREKVEVLTPFKASYDELMGLLPDARGVVLCAGLNMGPAEMDQAVQLEVIGRHGAGVDIVDVEAATERGIPVTFTPYGPTESTAEHALMLMLAVARRLPQLDRAVRGGDFHIRDRVMGQELEGKALGIVGFGRIGKRLAEICREGLHMAIYFFDPYVEAETAEECQATQIDDIVELAGVVDILSIHSPLTDKTRRLVGREAIQALGPDAILVNASRGPVVDEAALIEALESGHLGGAGLDVYDSEPPAPDNPLFQMDQVALTPHLASFTDEGRQRMGLMAVEEVLRVLRGEKPLNLANPEVWEHRRAIS
ncbi:MAG: hydroxyacid dehydrogenase [Chloroflexota bacterium]|nr:hydroxyacid dehydrogenase [Chloroflexota bacterium]